MFIKMCVYTCVCIEELWKYIQETVRVVEWLEDRGRRGVIFHRIFLSNF